MADKIFFDYEVMSIMKTEGFISIKIEKITIYKDFLEYESARLKGLYTKGNVAHIHNLN